MRFDKEKKNAIFSYLLEKIDAGVVNVIKPVCDEFGINQTTVHAYINELLNDRVISRSGRGKYVLTEESFTYTLSREKGEIIDEQEIFDKYVRGHLRDLPSNVREIWDYVAGEMINNVIDHSAAENLTLVVRKNFLSTALLISDDGVGIFEKIRQHYHMQSLDEAIGELFKGKLTTDPEHHSGEGIFFSSRMADLFIIRSDNRIFSINKYDNDALSNVPAEENGTMVFIELSNSSNKTAADIFNLYSQIDGGFQRTEIPLKNIFDSAPVSRSQAKRVCQRLDKFREVILDFEGLDWMGQGFAHEIFIVFCKKHPDIQIIPVNMSTKVEQMYLHVTGTVYD